MLKISDIQEILQEVYLPDLRYQYNEETTPLLSELEKDTESVVGKEVVMGLRYGRVGGIGARTDDGDLPDPNSRKTKQARWETKNLFARFQLTDKTIKASKGGKAFASMLEQEISDCEDDTKNDIARQVEGDGTGKLAVVTTAAGAATATQTCDATYQSTFLAEGMLVDLYDTGTDTLVKAKAEIIAVNDTGNGTVTFSNATSLVAATTYDVYVAGNKGLEITGIAAIFGQTGSIYGIDRANYPFILATRQNVAGEISENAIQKAIDRSKTRSGSTINFLLGSFGVSRAYQALLTATKRTVNSLTLKGGFTALEYNGMPLYADKYAPKGILRLLDTKDFKDYVMDDWNWLDADGAMLSRVPGKAAWEATLVRYSDIGCQRIRGQVEMYGIVEH